MKSLVDDVVVTYDEIVDTPETTLINPKKEKLLAYCFCPFNCLFIIAGGHHCEILYEAQINNYLLIIILI